MGQELSSSLVYLSICVQKSHVIGYLKYPHPPWKHDRTQIHSFTTPKTRKNNNNQMDLWVISRRSALPTFVMNTHILEILPKACRAWLFLWLLIHWPLEGKSYLLSCEVWPLTGCREKDGCCSTPSWICSLTPWHPQSVPRLPGPAHPKTSVERQILYFHLVLDSEPMGEA